MKALITRQSVFWTTAIALVLCIAVLPLVAVAVLPKQDLGPTYIITLFYAVLPYTLTGLLGFWVIFPMPQSTFVKMTLLPFCFWSGLSVLIAAGISRMVKRT